MNDIHHEVEVLQPFSVLDGNRLRVEKIGSFEDDPKRAFTDFFADTVMDTYEICC